MKLTNFDKGICVQACINSYARIEGEDIPEGHGAHGKIDWSLYEGKEKGSNCVNWWELYDNEKYSCGFTAIVNHPTYGIVGMIVFQGTTSSYNKIGWKSNFDCEQTKVMKQFNKDKGGLIVPYGNEDSKIRMHDGICQIWKLCRDSVREFAVKCFQENIPIWITGHSQGGGMTTACFIDLHYMFHTQMKVPMENMGFLTGYAAASLAIFNLEGAKSFNKRANGNFYREHIMGDPVTETPPWQMGYFHVEQCKAYSDLQNNLLYGPTHLFNFITLGFLPSMQAWNHDPRKLLAAVKGEPIPTFKMDTTKDEEK